MDDKDFPSLLPFQICNYLKWTWHIIMGNTISKYIIHLGVFYRQSLFDIFFIWLYFIHIVVLIAKPHILGGLSVCKRCKSIIRDPVTKPTPIMLFSASSSSGCTPEEGLVTGWEWLLILCLLITYVICHLWKILDKRESQCSVDWKTMLPKKERQLKTEAQWVWLWLDWKGNKFWLQLI